MLVEECNSDCINIAEELIEKSLSWFHAYYAYTCIKIGKCKAVICRDRDIVKGVGVFYIADTKPISIGIIYYVAVEQRFRGQGIGKIIVASIEELMDIYGVKLYIATTRLDNIPSRKMLEDLDYREILLESINGKLRDAIEKLTCAYEDDVLYVKSSKNKQNFSIETILGNKINYRIINDIWNILCYRPWIKIRQRR
jgi:GNAT superfamily N-acetyltransferase